MCVFAGALLCVILLSLPPLTPAEVVQKFSSNEDCSGFFVNPKFPNLPGIMKDGNIMDQNRYKALCQFYKNKYRFATLYDTTNKIPVFSAYKYTGKTETTTRSEQWLYEPQLEKSSEKEMKAVNDQDIYENQASNNNYKGSVEEMCVNRGHLFPVQHASDGETANSTFTLTNIVPQKKSFNGGSWADMETKVGQKMSESCRDQNGTVEAYVVTGAVPGKKKLKNKVNVPKLMWTAFCCRKKSGKWRSMAHWAENKDEQTALEPCSVKNLQEELQKHYGPTVQIFPDECNAEPV
ncbi:endonuclease domain-containing 1 protein-like [Arapaima gigas]